MANTTINAPLLPIMLPVILIKISGLGRLNAVETYTVEFGSYLVAKIRDASPSQHTSTSHAGLFRDLGGKIDRAGAVDNVDD